jgi:hypothetical protein
LTSKGDRTKKVSDVDVGGSLPKLVDRIMRFDSHIRHVIVLDSSGKPSVFIGRPGKVPLETGETQKMFFTRADLFTKVPGVEDRFLGKTRALIAQREKVTLMWFAFDEKFTILVSAEPGFPLRRVDALRRLVHGLYAQLLALRQTSASH